MLGHRLASGSPGIQTLAGLSSQGLSTGFLVPWGGGHRKGVQAWPLEVRGACLTLRSGGASLAPQGRRGGAAPSILSSWPLQAQQGWAPSPSSQSSLAAGPQERLIY